MRVARGEGDAARVEGAAAAVGAGPGGRRVAGQRELGEGVGAGRDRERRGGVGERVGRGLDGGAEGQRAGAGGDPEVAHGALPPSSLTTTLRMTRLTGWSSLVIEQVDACGSPAARVTLPASKAPPPPLVQVQVGRRVAGQRELGEGVGAGRDRERRGGVGEGVGRGLDGGAEGQRAGAGGDPEVAHDRAAAVVVDDDLAMTSWICLVFVNVQVDASPASMGTETLVSPASKPASPPMSAPLVITVPQTMSVSVQPARHGLGDRLGAELRRAGEGERGWP